MKKNMPLLARWSLYGIRTRNTGMLFVYVTLALSLILAPIGMAINDYTLITSTLVPLWYWFSVKWVDNNLSWEEVSGS